MHLICHSQDEFFFCSILYKLASAECNIVLTAGAVWLCVVGSDRPDF